MKQFNMAFAVGNHRRLEWYLTDVCGVSLSLADCKPGTMAAEMRVLLDKSSNIVVRHIVKRDGEGTCSPDFSMLNFYNGHDEMEANAFRFGYKVLGDYLLIPRDELKWIATGPRAHELWEDAKKEMAAEEIPGCAFGARPFKQL